ncbi:MAG: protease modulator HflC [Verrucomicrobiota bacterium]
MKAVIITVAIVIGVFVLGLASGALFVVPETKQVIITQFGDIVREPITEAGLKAKWPLIEEKNMIEKRILEWDGDATEMPTKDKTYIIVDTFARWKIKDPKQYFLRLQNERRAQSRLDDILGSETRNAIARHNLIEVIRTTKDRQPNLEATLKTASGSGDFGVLYPITKGRAKIETEIFQAAETKLQEFGIELLDIRFKRINYNETVRQRIYERMISERQQIAEQFRSEGAGEAAKIAGKKERDLLKIESEAYKTVQEVRGKADAEATEIYAKAYNQSRSAVDYYEFVKTLETYEKMMSEETTLILSTDSDLFKFLKNINN